MLSLIAVHGCRCDLDPIDRIPEAAATTNQNIIDFGEIFVGLRVSASFEIINSGEKPLLFADTELFPYTQSFVVNVGSEKVMPGETTTVTVIFRPTQTINYEADLSISYQNENGLITNVKLLGRGIRQTLFALTAAALSPFVMMLITEWNTNISAVVRKNSVSIS